MVTLFSSAREAVTFDEALSECAAVFKETATALIYGPRDCVFARLGSDGKLAFSPDRSWPSAEPVFEARVFSPIAEFRWLHQAAGRGRAVLLTEDAKLLEGLTKWDKLSTITTANEDGLRDFLDIRYLLWGTGTGDVIDEGWSRLAESRIGALDVPVQDIQQGGHAVLVSREYIVVEPDSGNAEVAEERLMSVEVLNERK